MVAISGRMNSRSPIILPAQRNDSLELIVVGKMGKINKNKYKYKIQTPITGTTVILVCALKRKHLTHPAHGCKFSVFK